MKRNYVVLVILFLTSICNAQIVTIPDAAFKALLLSANASNTVAKNLSGAFFKIDANSDGNIQLTEAQQVKELFIYESNAVSLQGLSSFTSLENLECEFSDVTSVDATALVNLKRFYFRYTPITSALISNLPLLESIYILTTSLPQINLAGLPSLKSIDISENNLTSLDVSGAPNLERIWCTNDDIQGLNFSNMTHLKQIWCMNLQLNYLTLTGATALEMLQCDHNNITDLNLTGLTNLNWLGCNYNPLGSIDLTGLTNITMLQICGNDLTTVDFSPVPNVNALYCHDNFLTTLPLSQIPNLESLYCSKNPITTLDFSVLNNLKGLVMEESAITNVDLSMMPEVLSVVLRDCQSLESVNIKNGNNEAGEILFNNTPSLQYVCADDGQLTTIQAHLTSIGQGSVSVSGYCSFAPGGANYLITGNSRFDYDSNGCTSTYTSVPYMRFNVSGTAGNGAVYGGSDGEYHIGVASGTHTMAPVLENPQYFTVSPTTSSVTFPGSASPSLKDYCLQANGVYNDLEIVVIPVTQAVPGFTQKLMVKFNNKGNTTLSGLISLDYPEAVLDYQSSTQLPINQTSGILTWDYQDLHPFESRTITVIFELNTPTETPPLNSGDEIPYIAAISPLENDAMAIDNIFKLDVDVVNSMDPNDKTCLEGNVVSPDVAGQYVHYLIRFENLGTAPAHNVVVKDMFNTSKFLINTLVPIASSHPFFTRFTAPEKYEFIFEGIDLPFDDANNDGFIAFKIKVRPPVTIGDTFSNTANIYFDFNAPIVTNTATTTVQLLATNEFEIQNKFSVYPNPVKDILNIGVSNESVVRSIKIFNLLGQLLLSDSRDGIDAIDVSSLATGSYISQISSDAGTAKVKFLKN